MGSKRVVGRVENGSLFWELLFLALRTPGPTALRLPFPTLQSSGALPEGSGIRV